MQTGLFMLRHIVGKNLKMSDSRTSSENDQASTSRLDPPNEEIRKRYSISRLAFAPHFAICLMMLLFINGEAMAQGYLNLHLKTLNETSSPTVPYTITGPNGYVSNFSLRDSPQQLKIIDIGSSQSGRLYAVTEGGQLFYRDVSTSTWDNSGISGISRVDGATGNQAWLVTTTGEVLKYSGSGNTAEQIYPNGTGTGTGKAVDVTFSLNTGIGGFILREDGSLANYYSGYWLEHSWGDIVGKVRNIDAGPGGVVYGSTIARVYSHVVSGSSTYLGSPASNIKDIAVAGEGNIYISSVGEWQVRKFNSGTTWDAFEAESYGTERITGGLGFQLWGTYLGDFPTLGNINSRAVNGQTGEILWIDDERVRSSVIAFYGNTRFIPLPAGTYTITQTAVNNWDNQKISIFNPTSGANTSDPVNRVATVTIENGQSTNVVWQVGFVNPFEMTTNCTVKYIEDFGTGAHGSFQKALNGQTSYHYFEEASNARDGAYRTVTRGSDFATWATGLAADHTADEGGAIGYMYAVNAGFDKGEFFRRRFTGLVVGARYKFAAYVASISNTTIKPNVDFKVYDAATKVLLKNQSTGDINTAFQWDQYQLEFIATTSSIDLVLDNNNVGGEGNDLALDDITFELMPPNDITTSVVGLTCSGTTTGSITVTAPLGSLIEYSINGGLYQASPIFNNVAPGSSHTVNARFVGTTGCVTTAVVGVPVSICGNVYNDINALKDNTVNGAGINTLVDANPLRTQVYVNLFDSSRGWLQLASVNADGSYSFAGVPVSDSYTVTVSNFKADRSQLLSFPNVTRLPAEYVHTGENIGSGVGNDGTVDGKLLVPVLLASRTDVNLGIERRPTVGSGTNTTANTLGSTPVTVPANTFTNTANSADYDGGSVTSIVITAIPTGASSITINGVTYTPANFPADGVTVPTNASGQPTQSIAVDPTADGATSVSIPFVAVDNGGVKSTATGTAVLNLTDAPAPVTVSGSVFNDASGNAVQDGSEPNTNAGGLYANLVNPATGAVIQSVPVNPTTGVYDFTNVPANANYNVILTKDDKTGASSLTASDLPATWVNTGVNTNGTPNTANKTGVLPVVVGTVPVTNQNMGIEQTPTAGSGSNTTANVPGTTPVTVPANTFTNTANSSDPGPGNVASIVITSIPTGASSITINGTTYTSANFPADGVTVPTNANGEPTQTITVDPTADGATSVSIPFVAVDNAGVKSTNTGTAVLNLTAATVSVSGSVFNDASGNAVQDGSEPNTNAGGLYANLVNPVTGAVIQSVPVNATTGAYDFTNVPVNTTYNVILTKDDKTGATGLTASDLPATWVNTGVNSNGTPNTGNKTGVLPVAVGVVPVSNQNLGIEQIPTAGSGTNTAVNTPGTTPATVPANTFTNTANSSDPTPGNVTAIVITAIPTGASSITINDVTYTSANFPAAGVTVPTDGNGQPTQTITVDPTMDGVTSVSIPFVAVDNAGVKSNNTGNAVINFIILPDLTPVIQMPLNSFNDKTEKNLIVYLEEVNGSPTLPGTATFSLTVPGGYSISTFNATLSTITPSGGVPTAVSNADWSIVFQNSTTITLRAKAGIFIDAYGVTKVGFTVKLNNAGAQGFSNMTADVMPDVPRGDNYDSNSGNNTYSRNMTNNN